MKRVIAFLFAAMTVSVFAQDSAKPDAGARTNTENAVEPSNLFSFEGSIDTSTGYYFRGYKYFSGGWNAQTDLTISLKEFKVGQVGFTPYLNVWANVQEQHGQGSFWDNLNEVDVNPGVDFTYEKLPNFTLEVQYNTHFFPSGTPSRLVGKGLEGQSQEIVVTVKYGGEDDNFDVKKITAAALHPHVSYAVEFEDRGDHSRDSYLEFGVEPKVKVTDKLTVSIPTILGCSTDSYYVKPNGHNDFVGYGSVGIHPKYQLTEHWDIHAGVDYIHAFSDGLANLNGQRDSVVGSVGVGFSY